MSEAFCNGNVSFVIFSYEELVDKYGLFRVGKVISNVVGFASFQGNSTYLDPFRPNNRLGGNPYSFIVEKYEKNPAAVAIYP